MKPWIAGASLIIVFLFLIVSSVNLHPMGEPDNRRMDDYFIGGEQEVCDDRCDGEECCSVVYGAQEELGVNNIVTAVVFDYRGFDTLGEATVLFAAIISVFMVFWGCLK